MNVACPKCKKESLVLGEHAQPKCSRCGYTDRASVVADEYIEEVLRISKYDTISGGDTWPVSDCPSCDHRTFVEGEHGDGPQETTGICFTCGEKSDLDGLAWCDEGGGHYYKPRGDDAAVICDAHFNEKVASAD